MNSPVAYSKLPAKARALISARQRSYIDEFAFYRRNGDPTAIEAWYAGCPIATWNGREWVSEIFDKPTVAEPRRVAAETCNDAALRRSVR